MDETTRRLMAAASSAGATSQNLTDIAWSGSVFIAVGAAGTILRSGDGLMWSLRYSGITANLNRVIWTGSQFVAVGASGTIVTSPDGSIWTPRGSGATYDFNNVISNGSLIVAIGSDISTSPDGVTWTLRKTYTGYPNNVMFGIATNGSGFAICGSNNQYGYSSDGITWPNFTSSGGGNGYMAAIWANSIYVLAPTIPYGSYTSPDGVTWTNRSVAAGYYLDIVWHNSIFVSVGLSGAIVTTPTGVTWTARTSGTTNHLRKVASNGSVIVAVGDSGTIVTSLDGATWTVRTSGITTNIAKAIWNGSMFVAVGTGGTILTSPDGATWSRVN